MFDSLNAEKGMSPINNLCPKATSLPSKDAATKNAPKKNKKVNDLENLFLFKKKFF